MIVLSLPGIAAIFFYHGENRLNQAGDDRAAELGIILSLSVLLDRKGQRVKSRSSEYCLSILVWRPLRDVSENVHLR